MSNPPDRRVGKSPTFAGPFNTDIHHEVGKLLYAEPTPEQLAQLEESNAMLSGVNEYRTQHGIVWGGPPYTEAELEYARERLRKLAAAPDVS